MEKTIKLNKGQRDLLITMCYKAENELDGFIAEQIKIIREKIEKVNKE